MRRMHASRACCVAILFLVGLSSLLAWYTHWAGFGVEGGAAHWERYLKGDFNAFAKKGNYPQRLQYDESRGDYIESNRYNNENFMKRRKAKLAKLKAKLAKKGKIHKYTSSKVVSKAECVKFLTARNDTRLCVHSKLADQFISSHIRDTGSWEPDLLAAMATALSSDPELHLLDIGCNLGTFTMYAALMGRKVLAVDPIRSNLFMLHSSLVYSGLRDNVTLLLNAVSDYAERVRVLINEENLGGSRVEPVTDSHTGSDIIVDAIRMDDLVRVMNFKKVFIKIDIEGYEANALRRSSRFFKTFNVRYIMMEWMLHRHSSRGGEIIDILVSRGFRPYADVQHKASLNMHDYYLWPDNMFWYKNNTS